MVSRFPLRTMFSGLGLSACCASCVCLAQTSRKPIKTPHMPAASAAVIDPQAMALLQRVEKAMLSFQTYQAECRVTLWYPPRDGKPARERQQFARLLAAKPNKMHYDTWSLNRNATTGQWERDLLKGTITFVGDGKTNWKQFGKRYRIDTFTKPEAMSTILEPWEGFYAAQSSPHGTMVNAQKQHALLELRWQGAEAVESAVCKQVFAHLKTGYNKEAQEYWQTWYTGADNLVRRKVERIEFDGKLGYTRTSTIQHVRTNAPIPAREFTYTPPAGVVSTAEAVRNQPAPPISPRGIKTRNR